MGAFQKIILIFLVTAASIVATFITPGMNELKNLFLISSHSLSYVMTIYLIGYLLGQISFALFSKRYGGISSLRYGFILCLAGFILQYLSVKFPVYYIFLLGRFITAFGLSSGLVCGFAIIKDNILPNEEKGYFSIIAIAFTGSIYFSIFISGTLIKVMGLLFILKIQILYTFLLLILTFFVPNTKVFSYKEQPPIARYQFLNYKLISYAMALSITTIIAYCYSFYAPLIMINYFRLEPQDYGYYNLINMCGLFLGSTIYSQINHVIKENAIIIFSLISIALIGLVLVMRVIGNGLDFQQFIYSFFAINLFSGIIYPAATFKSLECGSCKTSSSATMNIIKIGMPSMALYLSLFISSNNFLNLSLIIVLFSSIYLISVIAIRKLNEVVFLK